MNAHQRRKESRRWKRIGGRLENMAAGAARAAEGMRTLAQATVRFRVAAENLTGSPFTNPTR